MQTIRVPIDRHFTFLVYPFRHAIYDTRNKLRGSTPGHLVRLAAVVESRHRCRGRGGQG
jgi:hypothetical protein